MAYSLMFIMRLYTLPKHSSIDTSPHSLPNKTKKNSPTTSPSSITNPATNTLPIENAHPPRHPFTPYKISFNFLFCSPVNVPGNLTLYLTTKLPLPPPFFGIPKSGYVSLLPGCVGPPLSMTRFLPSMVVTVRFQPVRASLRSSSRGRTMSSPSRVKRGCFFWERS